MPRKPSDQVRLKLRIDERLRRRLEREAARSDRSMNSEIIERLEQSFDFEKTDALAAALTGGRDNATLLRLISTAIVFGGQWKEDSRAAEALRYAISYIVASYAGLPLDPTPPEPEARATTTQRIAAALAGGPVNEPKISGKAIAHVILTRAGLPGLPGMAIQSQGDNQ